MERLIEGDGPAVQPGDGLPGRPRRAVVQHPGALAEVPSVHGPASEPVVRGGLRSLPFVIVSVLATALCGLAFGAFMYAVLALTVTVNKNGSVPRVTLWVLLLVPTVACLLAYGLALFRGWRHGARIVLRSTGARAVSAHELQMLRNVSEEVALAAGVDPPSFAVVETPVPNALVVGSRGTATIAVTSGLLSSLPREELEAVIAHELAHIRNGDLGLTTLMAASTASVAAFTRVLGLTAAATGALVGAAGRTALRERVYAADDAAVHLTRDPAALIAVLERLQAAPADDGLDEQPAFAPLCFVDPVHLDSALDARGRPARRSSQPSVGDRLERLRQLVKEPKVHAQSNNAETGTH